jgi:hypothetical protein
MSATRIILEVIVTPTMRVVEDACAPRSLQRVTTSRASSPRLLAARRNLLRPALDDAKATDLPGPVATLLPMARR